ncbi:toxin-antitoxin system, toxin component [Streptomyces bobili]|uniref:toxin-antitoxin system, toxin component n=1 Tax=Streptomyces bobili TaxID=67280 RepID=UPI0037B5F933
MKHLTSQIINALQPPATDEDLIPAISNALCRVRGRPVRLRPSAFPPDTASGLWIDARDHDLIVYEANTHPLHQQVIIGHEAWHMFAGHCGSPTAHGPVAARAEAGGPAAQLEDVVRRVTALEATDMPPTELTDTSLHIAALRADSEVQEEKAAERFGILLRTAIDSHLEDVRVTADLRGIAGRIQVSMAHRGHRA